MNAPKNIFKKSWFVFSFLLLFILSATSAHSLFGFFDSTHQKVTPQEGKIEIPIKDVSDTKAHYFSYTHNDKNIHFFVVKSQDGIIRAAFDACDVCFPAKKGYSQEGEFMVCNNCGRKFHSSRINVVQGGCNPAPLKRTPMDDKLVIQVNDILTGTKYF